MKKICKKCNEEKEIEEFYLKDKKIIRYDKICKSCRKIYFRKKYNNDPSKIKERGKLNRIKFKNRIKKYREENRDKINEQTKDWRKRNKNKTKEYSKKYSEKNKEIIKEKQKKYKALNKNILLEKDKIRYKNNKEKKLKYYQDNKEKILNRQKSRRINNREEVLKKDSEWRNNNRHIILWRSLLRRTIIQLRQEKINDTETMLGYSAVELKNHIEKNWLNGMNWENYGDWHVDHIRSVGTFESTSLPSEVNALSNLKPMWSTTRIIEGILYEGNLNKGKKFD